MPKFPIRTAMLGLALALGTATSSFAQAAGGVLVVNVTRVFEESAAGKAAIAQLRPQADQFTQRQRGYQTEFQKEGAALQSQAQAKTLVGAALQAKVQDFERRQQTAQAELQSRQQALQAADASVRRQILDGMTPIVNTLLKERGATVAIPTTVALGNAPGSDITADVISRLDRALPRVSTTAPAAPAR